MLILWFASPFYHSLPENATRSRVPRLNAPMGTPRPHVSRHLSGRALRRGRRPRRPASAHPRIPAHFRLSLRRGGVLPRPPSIFCFRMYASGGHISFNSERNMEKNAAKNHRFLDFPFVQLQLRCKKVPHRIACTPIPAAAPAYRAKTFFSRAAQEECFTSYIILYPAAQRAAPMPLLAKAGRSGERNVPAPRLRTKRYPSGSAGGVSQFT